MSTSSPEDLSGSTVIRFIEAGSYPRETVLTIARGFLPLEQDDLVAVLAYLGGSEDQEIAGLARTALGDIPPRVITDFASNEDADATHLQYLLRATSDALVLEALIRNRAVRDDAVADLARRAEPRVQEVIVINHARILRAPEILDALLENRALSPNTRRLVHEAREEFFLKKARLEEEPEVIDIPLDPIADLLERAALIEEVLPTPPTVTLSDSELAVASSSNCCRLASRGTMDTLRCLLPSEDTTSVEARSAGVASGSNAAPFSCNN